MKRKKLRSLEKRISYGNDARRGGIGDQFLMLKGEKSEFLK
jgi:hypothetical protein